MPTYAPLAFREDDLPILHDMMDATRLSNLITVTAEGLIATPLPLFLVRGEGAFGTLYGHLILAAENCDLSARGFLPGASSGAQVKTLSGWYYTNRQMLRPICHCEPHLRRGNPGAARTKPRSCGF